MIEDGEILTAPITSAEGLMEAAKANPGRITYPAPPDFTGSAFVRNILADVVGIEKIKKAGKDEAKLKEVLEPGFKFLEDIEPYLWKEGKTYPADVNQLDNLFADGEVSFTVSYNPFHILSQKASGHFPEKSFVSIFDNGTFGNTHFVSVAFNAPNKEASYALINEIISAEAQAEKYDPMVWGDLPVTDSAKMTNEEKALFNDTELGEGALTQEELLSKRIPELDAEVLLIIEKLWSERIP